MECVSPLTRSGADAFAGAFTQGTSWPSSPAYGDVFVLQTDMSMWKWVNDGTQDVWLLQSEEN